MSIGAPSADLPQPGADLAAASSTARSTELRNQYELVSTPGRTVLAVTQDREAHKWTPFTQTGRFPTEDTLTIRKRQAGESISESDIAEAQRVSLAIALEAATQINEFRPSANAGIRENQDSLTQLMQAIRQGGILNYDLIKQNPSLVAAAMKKVISRRQKASPDSPELTEEQLTTLADQQFRNALGRLNKSAKALSGYLGR